MATLTCSITKKSVTRTQDKLYSITINLSLKDGTIEVLNRDFSFRYRTGDAVNKKYAEVLAQMQAVIDNYKAEKVLFDATAFNTVITNLQNNLNL